MSVSKSAPGAGDVGPSVRRTASIETLPQYTSGEEDRRRSLEDAATPLPGGWYCHLDPHSNHHYYVDMNSTPPRSVWQHPRHIGALPPPPLPTDGAPLKPRRGLIGKLKEKMKDLEAQAQQEEAKKRELLLARYSKRRDEVMAELAKDGTKYGGSQYVGPPSSPYGGFYRALMPAPGLNENLAGWLA